MRKSLLLVFLFFVQYSFGQQQFQLAAPLLKYSSTFFSGSTSLQMIFDQPGAEIYYTLNDKEPTQNDLLYKTALVITTRTVVKAKTFGKNFLPSETSVAEFIKAGKMIRQISFSTPNEKYTGNKTDILNDNIGGNTNFNSGDWLGYNNDTVEINIDLAKKEAIHSVLVNILQDENSWIFLPGQILVYYRDKQKIFLPTGKEFFFSESQSPKQCSAKEIIFSSKIKTDNLKLILLPLKKIPEWHPGKGNHAWLFIDEIKVY